MIGPTTSLVPHHEQSMLRSSIRSCDPACKNKPSSHKFPDNTKREFCHYTTVTPLRHQHFPSLLKRNHIILTTPICVKQHHVSQLKKFYFSHNTFRFFFETKASIFDQGVFKLIPVLPWPSTVDALPAIWTYRWENPFQAWPRLYSRRLIVFSSSAISFPSVPSK